MSRQHVVSAPVSFHFLFLFAFSGGLSSGLSSRFSALLSLTLRMPPGLFCDPRPASGLLKILLCRHHVASRLLYIAPLALFCIQVLAFAFADHFLH